MRLFNSAKKKRPHVSAILKRQIPIRFDEQPHSWLGGLPMMPETVEWPRDPKGAPLHFVAQVSCARLPSDVWNGQGPREGWLLYFIETIKLEDEAGAEFVRILHIEELGPEREPPAEMPTVRHTMSDFRDYATQKNRPGVPKLWRKWPIDLVEQKYELDGGEEDYAPPPVSAAALYGATVAENGTMGAEKFGIERPLSWRGALYFVEGVVHDLDPTNFEHQFRNHSGLLGAPEADYDELVSELNSRCEANPGLADRSPGWGPRSQVIRDQIKADLKEERSTGWMKRAYVALDKSLAEHEKWRDTYQSKAEENDANLPESDRLIIESSIVFHSKAITEIGEARSYLDALFASYPGPEGEQRFNAEIRAVGEAHLKWGKEMAERAEKCLQEIRSRHPDESISSTDWTAIWEQFSTEKSVYWHEAGPRCLAKSERGLALEHHLIRAIQEDLLDLYTCDPKRLQSHSEFQLDAFEQKLRYMEAYLPHRIGGHANPVQGEGMPGHELLLQLASDTPMGWVWGDAGAVYVVIPPKDLRKGRFTELFAMLEGH